MMEHFTPVNTFQINVINNITTVTLYQLELVYTFQIDVINNLNRYMNESNFLYIHFKLMLLTTQRRY